MRRGQRTPEEDKARGRCRGIVRFYGSSLRKSEDGKYIILSECDLWPEGALFVFQGWIDLLDRLETMIQAVQETTGAHHTGISS